LLDKYDLLFTDAVKDKIDFLEKIEELLILSDIGPKTTGEILGKFEEVNLHQFKTKDFNHFKTQLKNILVEMIPEQRPALKLEPDVLNIIMIVGVNGTGKTSFAGKLANYFKNKGKKCLLVPADTYRAGAINQLTLLANEAGVETLKTSEGADSASVVFDGLQSAMAKKKELLIIDTAGRLHTYHNLMKELEKIKRVIIKTAPEALLKTILVIDATTGQNGLIQARHFKESLDISNLALTKLDGTAKGGIVLTIQKELHIPVEYITFGEKIDNLTEYDPENFIEALLD
jgi:fused signal recognition particle receptor